MTERHLTVSTLRESRSSRQIQPDREVPYLRMRGRWLSELGFDCGERVRVEAAPGRLVITPISGER